MPHEEIGQDLRTLARRVVEDAPVDVLKGIVNFFSSSRIKESIGESLGSLPGGGAVGGGISATGAAARHLEGEGDEGTTGRPSATGAPSGPSPLERSIEALERRGEQLDEHRGEVQRVLAAAGVHPDQIRRILANPSHLDLVAANPKLAQEFARAYPASHVVPYYETARELGFPEPVGMQADPRENPELMKPGAVGTLTSPTGAKKLPNGVIIDPNTGTVHFPPNDPTVAGSPAWLQQATSWDQERVKKWRKELTKLGYLGSPKGGVDVAFIDALREYHTFRYVYGDGKPISKVSEEAKVAAEDFGGVLDKSVLRGEVRGWFQAAYGDDPSDDELEFWTDRLRSTSLRLARNRDWEPAEAASVARARQQERFLQSPEAQLFQEGREIEEENTKLRDSILSVAQMVGR